MKPKYYITTPIYYVNDSPHIGHAYTTIACDVMARFKRLDGYEVHFLTGTDEHGQKIEKAALKAGIDTKLFTDQVSETFRVLKQTLNLSNDIFIRTTDDYHIKAVQALWTKLVESGNIYLGKYAGWYSVRDEAFYSESELVNGKAPTGADVEWVEEPSYFFKLSAWQDKLLKFYEENPDFIAPEARRNEVISFVKSGLIDLSVSRITFKWGINVPGDEKHVIYVWLDALTNYISAAGYPDQMNFWPADVHVVGKDILRFHAVYWPAFLMAANIQPPKKIFAHGWWTVEGEKMSKSLGNTTPPKLLVDEYGVDYVRYYLMREMPFGNDGDFSKNSISIKINSDLANNFGNLAQRVLSFINKNCDSKISSNDNLQEQDNKLLHNAYQVLEKMRKLIDSQSIFHAFDELIKLSSEANEYIDSNAPWNLKKTDLARMEAVLYTLAEVIRVIAILFQPLIPESAGKILNTLNVKKRDFEAVSSVYRLKVGEVIQESKAVFPRMLK
jgi:methionyl-tRNA synthetase